MFEPIIAPIAFALIMLGIAVFAVIRAVGRRVSRRNVESDSTSRTVHSDGRHAAPGQDSEFDRSRTRRAG